KFHRAQGCAGSLPGFRLATIGEPRQARGRWCEGRARRAWTEGRSRIERRDDSRLENRSRALRCDARDVGRPRGSAARIARAVRAIFARDEIVVTYAVCNRSTWRACTCRAAT